MLYNHACGEIECNKYVRWSNQFQKWICSECGFDNETEGYEIASGKDVEPPWSSPKRPSWNTYFMWLAAIARTRATCDRRHVGCVIVSSGRHVMSTGYNGSAPGAPHCDKDGHLMHNDRCVRTIHAEANAIAQAARNGIPLLGGTAYVTVHPCPSCLLLLASAGVLDVIHLEEYHAAEDDISRVLADGANITIKRYEGSMPWER